MEQNYVAVTLCIYTSLSCEVGLLYIAFSGRLTPFFRRNARQTDRESERSLLMTSSVTVQ